MKLTCELCSFEYSVVTLGENCALAANQSVDCPATTLFTISLNSAKAWNRGFNWTVFSVGMHKKSPNGWHLKFHLSKYVVEFIFQFPLTTCLTSNECKIINEHSYYQTKEQDVKKIWRVGENAPFQNKLNVIWYIRRRFKSVGYWTKFSMDWIENELLMIYHSHFVDNLVSIDCFIVHLNKMEEWPISL